MLSTLAVTWRLVRRRLAADWLVAGAAFATIILAIALLGAGPIYADAVALSALQRTLTDSAVTDSNITVEVSVYPDLFEQADATVRGVVDRATATTGAEVLTHIEAEAFQIGDAGSAGAVPLASFQYFEGIPERATLVSGRWPDQAGPPFETTVSVSAAESLGLAVGDVLEVSSRRDQALRTSVEIVGTYQIDDTADPFWFDDTLAILGEETSPSFDTFGPFVVTLETVLHGLTTSRVDAGWRVLPDYQELTVSEIDRLGASVASLGKDLDRAFSRVVDKESSGTSSFTVVTGLPELLATVDRSLTVTRSSVLALLVQLALLAGYALVLTAGLMVDARRTETSLLRSRGTSPRQILGSSLLEGLVLVIPAVAIGPYLGMWLLRLLNHAGPLAAIGLSIDPVVNRESFLLAIVAGALALTALTWPAHRAARRFPEEAGSHRRQRTDSATQRVGVDVALIGLAIVVFWQLQVLGPQISASVRGRFGVDPLLVVAPAIGLLTGAVLALRIVPLLARVAEWLASSGRSTVSALASWQVARRPIRYARSALLLMMAIGIGFFAASYSTTWIGTQRDQAEFAVGADIVVRPNRATGSSLPDLVLESAHTSVEGIASSMPVVRLLGQLGETGGLGQFFILDASKASDVVRIRPDLAPEFGDLMQLLVSGRPEMGAVALPGEPTSLTLDFEAVEELPDEEEAKERQIVPVLGFQGQARVILQDGDGRLYRVIAGNMPVNEGPQRLSIDLTEPLREGVAHPVYPLQLVNIEIRSQIPDDYSRIVHLHLDGITVSSAEGSAERVAMATTDWEVSVGQVVGATTSPAISPGASGADGSLDFAIETGVGFMAPPVYMSIRPQGTRLPQDFPAIVSEDFAATGLAQVGETLRMAPLRIEHDNVAIAGEIGSFPTSRSDLGPIVVLDLPTYQMMGYEPGYGLAPVDEYWLAADGDTDAAVTSLRAPPISSFHIDTVERLTDRLVSDPVALGTIGALTVGFVAAAVFAAVGFAVSATVSARERLIEFALLRALGLSPRQLGSWLVLEQGALVLASLGLGTLIGMLLTAFLLPLVTLTQGGRPAFPEVMVIYPWTTVVWLELAVVAVLACIVTVLTAVLRRVGLGSMLRLGED
ncbi:MAG: FtsX-like permease family protein [Acidimicrobiia bacterium]